MTIAFTLCSNNYLAHAKTLGDSYLSFHPDHKFFIGLVDKLHEDFDYSFLDDISIVPLTTLSIEEYDFIVERYNVKELNTVVKPSYFKYIFKTYKAEKVIFLDPDILVISKFTEVLDWLDHSNIVLTPQLLSPLDDSFTLSDFQLLRDGIFNLGFLALSDYGLVSSFLNFWHERVIKYGFGNSSAGMFYDQLWVNYVPVFYDNYHILKHHGYNMANWNLHERLLGKDKDGFYVVNKKHKLRFFHFSGYDYNQPEIIASYSNRFDFIQRPDLKEIFDTYNLLLLKNRIEEISKLPVFYSLNQEEVIETTIETVMEPQVVEEIVKEASPPIYIRVFNRVKLTIRVFLYGK